ncbi:MAG: N-succinylarginine dihydrolase [Planctomycetaceae bacterium]
MLKSVEVNLDGLIGPTHHYGGLAEGNLASQRHRHRTSRPREAALQGLRKMKVLADRGIPQFVLPPAPRPDVDFLREQGFSGAEQEILREVARCRGDLLSIACSASSMWAANAATVSPSADTRDARLHVTPANLRSTAHRRLEVAFTTRLLKCLFADTRYFVVHDPLPDAPAYSDEGAANHMRLCKSHASAGVEVFVYGRNGIGTGPRRHPARQTLAASRAIADRHELDPRRTLFVQQSPEAIDAGVFHNDVIAVANEHLLLCHEQAYVAQPDFLRRLKETCPMLRVFEVSVHELSLEQAVQTYLFNSQLATLPEGGMLLLAPRECEDDASVRAVLARLREQVPEITEIQFIDVRQSMRNGGGPACLRLRVVLSQEQLSAMPTGPRMSEALYARLTTWIERNYREELTFEDLGDPGLLRETRSAFEELAEILNLHSIYSQDPNR